MQKRTRPAGHTGGAVLSRRAADQKMRSEPLVGDKRAEV